MSQQDRYGYRNGYGDYGRSYYRGRRRPRSPFGDIKLASLGKLYADVPVDAVTKAMEGLNLQYKENRDAQDKYQAALANAQVMVGDDPEKQRMIKDIQGKVDQFVENTGGAYEKGDDFVRGLAKDVVASPWLAQAIQNKNKFDEDQKSLDQMRIKGLAPLYYSPENFTTMGIDGSPQQYQSYIGSQVNRKPALEAFFKNLKADRKDTYNKLFDVFTTSGISQDRVNEVIKGAMPSLMETKEYRQSLENAQAEAQYSGVPFDKNMFDAQWAQQLQEVGNEFVYSDDRVNLNRSLRNAMFTADNDNDTDTIQKTSVENFGAGMIGGVEQDSWFSGGSSSTDDPFKFYSENTKYDPTFNQESPTQQRLMGNVINLIQADGNMFTGGKFFNKPSNQTYNARRTGNVYSVPVIADFNKNGVYGNNQGAIQKAFKEQLNLEWNPEEQSSLAGQLPHEGKTGGFGPGSNRFSRNYTGFEPRQMQVGNYTISYLMPADEGDSPIVVEMLPKMEYEVFDATGEERKGTVLGDMSPQTAAHFMVNPDIRWSSYKQEQGIVDKAQTIIRLNSTIDQISRVPGSENIVQRLQAIQANVQSTGLLDAESISLLNQIDRTYMPQVLRGTNLNIAKPDEELSKRKSN